MLLTEAGIAFIVSAITRTCAGPISPAASAAAVFGSAGGSISPYEQRWVMRSAWRLALAGAVVAAGGCA
ncbi:MAG: hypothetical protein ACRDRY_16695 [Pseudonocardiaceae bacterium]